MKKDEALDKFASMIMESWTYDRMTKEEQTRLIGMLYDGRTRGALKGSFYQRWAILQAVYGAFLCGLGYDNHNWRESEVKKVC